MMRFIKRVLCAEKIRKADLCIVCADRRFVRQLNRRFSAKDADTDVLSFDLSQGEFKSGYLTGDVVVSVDRAVSVASLLHLPFKEEICRYVLHGILHLAGYDDLTAGKKKKMWKRQEYLLKRYLRIK